LLQITPSARCRRWWGPRRAECEAEPSSPTATERSVRRRTYRWTGGRSRPAGVSGPAGRPRNPRPPSGRRLRGWGDAAAVVPKAVRHPDGWWAPRRGGCGWYGSWSQRAPRRGATAEVARCETGGTRNAVDAGRSLGGSHEGPPFPPPPAKGLHAEVASSRTIRALGLADGRCVWESVPSRGRSAGRYDTARPRLGRTAGCGAGRSVRLPVSPRSLPPMAAPGPTCHYPTALRWSQAHSAMTSSTLHIPITTSADVRGLEQASLLDDTAETTAREACVVCPHTPSSHDAIAARFCSATRDGAIVRGCVCQS
jgi:hypothetical protein